MHSRRGDSSGQRYLGWMNDFFLQQRSTLSLSILHLPMVPVSTCLCQKFSFQDFHILAVYTTSCFDKAFGQSTVFWSRLLVNLNSTGWLPYFVLNFTSLILYIEKKRLHIQLAILPNQQKENNEMGRGCNSHIISETLIHLNLYTPFPTTP